MIFLIQIVEWDQTALETIPVLLESLASCLGFSRGILATVRESRLLYTTGSVEIFQKRHWQTNSMDV